MTFLKNLAVSLFGFLLFLSLTIFGLAFTVKSTALNPDFITAELDRLEISSLVEEFVQIEAPSEIPNLNEIVHKTISSLEPQLKEQSAAAINSAYDYLLGETQEPDLKLVLRKTFLSTDFVTPLVNSIDISSLAGPFLSQQFAQAIPIEIPNLDKYVSDALAGDEPALKEQIVAISGPVFDYLLMESPTLKVSISLEPVKESLTRVVLDSPPPELAVIPRDLRETYFNQFYQEFTKEIPATYPIDEKLVNAKLRTDLAQVISSAEESLRQARQYIKYIQQAYTLLLFFMPIIVLGIILVVRNLKHIADRFGIRLLTHGALEYAGVWVTKYLLSSGKMKLGIPLLVCGALEYAGVWVIKYLLSSGKIKLPGIPIPLQNWLLQLVNDSMTPVEIFSLSVLIVGAVLTVISFLYKRNQDLSWT